VFFKIADGACQAVERRAAACREIEGGAPGKREPDSEEPLRPDGTRVQLSARTIEAWYHAYRCGGFQALFPRDRGDRGRSRAIGAEIAEHILRAKRERPRRSICRIGAARWVGE